MPPANDRRSRYGTSRDPEGAHALLCSRRSTIDSFISGDDFDAILELLEEDEIIQNSIDVQVDEVSKVPFILNDHVIF